MDPSSLETLIWLGKVAAAITTLIVFFGGIYVGCKKCYKIITNIMNILSINDKIDLILSEFKCNSGKSLKDQLNTIEKHVGNNTKTIASIFNKVRWQLDHRDEPIFETNSQGEYTWVNEAYLRLAHRPVNEIIGNGWKNVIWENNRHNFVTSWDSAISEERDFEQEYHIFNKKGQIFKSNCIANRTDGGGYIGALFNIEEIIN